MLNPSPSSPNVSAHPSAHPSPSSSGSWSDDSDLAEHEAGPATPKAHLVAVRFGEYLRDCDLITDEQWLAALASHWSEEPRRRIGDIVVAHGYLPVDVVERAADQFHDGLDVVEVGHGRR